jgi:hypothetical protein
MNDMEILDCLDKGEITASKAVSLIKENRKQKKSNTVNKSSSSRKARWIRIKVKDDGNKFRFYVPVFLLNLGFSIGKLAIGSKHSQNNEGVQSAQKILNNINQRDIKKLINAIKDSGKINLVEVVDRDTFINISIV